MNQKFLAVNYEGAKNLIDTIFSAMENDVLIDGKMKLIYFVDESVRITKGWYQTRKRLSKLIYIKFSSQMLDVNMTLSILYYR